MNFNILKHYSLQIILIFLILIYLIATPKTEKSIETALLNPKYSPDKITLSYSKEGTATLTKCGTFWICDYISPDGMNSVFPCDNSIIENLLENAGKIIKVYEISDNLRQKDRFSLSQDESFCMEFSQEGKTVSKLFFGSADSRKRIAFYSDMQSQKKAKIYSTNSPILNYLNASPDFWCDPYIFPKSVCGNLDAEEVARLRHGKVFLGKAFQAFAIDKAPTQSLSKIELDDGKGNVYKAFFMPANDDEGNYYCRFIATPSAARSTEEKLAIESLDYVTMLSAWTYNKLIISAAK